MIYGLETIVEKDLKDGCLACVRQAYCPIICGEKMRNIDKNISLAHVQANSWKKEPFE
jgi:hypothetical protein